MSDHAEAHARLSPSGSKRWMACPGSITLESAMGDSYSAASDKGTAMHTVAKMCLTEHWPAGKAINTNVPVNAPGEHIRVVLFTPEMSETVQRYVDTVRYIGIGCEMYIEERVEFSNWVGVPNQFGTADAIILIPIDGEPGCYELVVIDLKTGYKKVDPENNSQGMLYALGALNMFEMSHNITRVRIGIYQEAHGGLREWTVSMEDLMEFAKRVRAAADRVELAAKTYGQMGQLEWEQAFLNPTPNEDECAFCRVRASCPAAARVVEDVTGATMQGCADVFTIIAEAQQNADPVVYHADPIPVLPDPAYLSRAMKAVGFIEDWCNDVRAEVERQLMAGHAVEGFGLELGRKGPRKWTDIPTVIGVLRKQFRLSVEDAFDLSLKSPTSIEAMAPKYNKKGELVPTKEKPTIGPRQWTALQEYITRAEPKPSVKPAHVIKVPYSVAQPDASTFTAIEEDMT